LNGTVGIELARIGAIVAGICLALVGSMFFLPVDRCALELSRRLRKRMPGESKTVHQATAGAGHAVLAE
jgi:hypothetical protein